MKHIAVRSSKPSSVTAKLIRATLRARGYVINSRRTRGLYDLVINWGCSIGDEYSTRGRSTLNSVLSVRRTSNKLTMINALTITDGVEVPEWSARPEDILGLCDSQGGVYIRPKHGGKVRYANASEFSPERDLYATQPIPKKRREYRVHVALGAIMGIYEKVPYSWPLSDLEPDSTEIARPKLYNQESCHFKRLDPSRSLCDATGQRMAIAAVNALCLDFGAVDLARTSDKKYVVIEVNSSAGLSQTNVNRLCDLIEANYASGIE